MAPSSVVKRFRKPAFLLTLCFTALTVNSEDQYCMNRATKDISVEVSADNPQRIMTYVRDEPGYPRGLVCKWNLRASDYTQPVQMFLTVTNKDFDVNNATEEQCQNSNADVFNFTFSGALSKGQIKSQHWCSNDMVAFNKAVANIWNSSNDLSVEFRSDQVQTRPNAKGVQLDVLILSKDYCHRTMLYSTGSCYLITSEKLTFEEALNASKFVMGNVATFQDMSAVEKFLADNQDRQAVYPFSPAFDLAAEKRWTGHFLVGQFDKRSQYADPLNDCRTVTSDVAVSTKDADNRPCGIALQVVDGRPLFTCEPMDSRLPALLKFPQISDSPTARDLQGFRSCFNRPLIPPKEDFDSGMIAVFIVVGIAAACLVISIPVLFIKKRKQRRSNNSGNVQSAAEDETKNLKAEEKQPSLPMKSFNPTTSGVNPNNADPGCTPTEV